MISKVLAGHEIVLDSPSHTFTIKFESKNKKNYLIFTYYNKSKNSYKTHYFRKIFHIYVKQISRKVSVFTHKRSMEKYKVFLLVILAVNI